LKCRPAKLELKLFMTAAHVPLSPAASPHSRLACSLISVTPHHDTQNTHYIYLEPKRKLEESTAMSNPLAEYLAALEVRDKREKKHETYINACQ
jgi:hypothetical protein